jgi:hypothetical protein
MVIQRAKGDFLAGVVRSNHAVGRAEGTRPISPFVRHGKMLGLMSLMGQNAKNSP